ncbi:hypothetical protein CPC08DRAFT_714011 [Agrocybe pediades]|nr:hypothetical protein CPC08DRAFT_714011 [Agrocybe pediades]
MSSTNNSKGGNSQHRIGTRGGKTKGQMVGEDSVNEKEDGKAIWRIDVVRERRRG